MPTPRHHRLPKVPAIPSDCFYVKLCSNHRDPLFPAATDRGALNEIMIDELLRFDAQLHAYCWLTHHLHALLEVDAGVLSRFIRRIATRYSQHRHSLSQTREHLFERPYQARRVTTADDFLALLRFIHLSPVQTMLAVDAADYPWSSHRAYLNDDCYSWVTTEIGLGLFAN